jgi:cytochrome oxidase Cu insertion factor (SCO1/SenC/PrrC family)
MSGSTRSTESGRSTENGGRRRGRSALAALAAASLGLAPQGAAEAARYTRAEVTVDAPGVSLVAADGAAVDLRAELARPGPLLVQFGFTTCATACPVLSGAIAAALAEAPSLRALSISIDPEADTPARLREHASRLGAGPRWRFLTGSPEAVLAAQQAFDVYRGNKMRHEPVLFVRGAASSSWVRLDGFPNVADLVAETARPPAAGDAARGRRLYREGVLASGEPLRGVLQGDVPVSGAPLACATCHRRSGRGGVEGGVHVPPVTGRALFAARGPDGPDLFRQLFQEELAPRSWSRVRDSRWRPPYDDETLVTALRSGRDSAGGALDPLMPRYALEAPDVRHLAAYLRTLDAEAPGVGDSTLHLATVVAGAVDPEQRRAMLDVVTAFVRWRNDGARHNLRRPAALRYDDTAAGVRGWALHVWELQGPAADWPGQLEARYREQPVFALLSGLGAGSWAPVETFCERRELPCLFPNTDLPGAPSASAYTVYLSAGLAAEALAVADEVVASVAQAPAGGRTRVVQVLRDLDRGRVPARALRGALRGVPGVVEDRVLPRAGPLAPGAWRAALRDPGDVLVLWLDEADLTALVRAMGTLEAPARVYLSASLTGEGPLALPAEWRAAAHLASAFAPAGGPAPHRNRARAWLRSRGVEPRHERLQLATYYTLSLADHALMHLGRDLSRDAFLEAIEREAEREPNPGPFPRLSLGPGQRVAAKGCAVVRLDEAAGR